MGQPDVNTQRGPAGASVGEQRLAFATAVRSCARRFRLDRAVSFGMAARIWQFVVGPVTVVLVATCLTPAMQGYYYTFSSLAALHVLVELGLGQLLLQFASHEWARLAVDRDGGVSGDLTAKARLASLLRHGLRWYRGAGSVLFVGLLGIGFTVFGAREDGIPWVLPWIAVSTVTAASLPWLAHWMLFEGCGRVGEAYRQRFLMGTAVTVATWTALWTGAGLWAPAAAGLVRLAWSAVLFLGVHRRFFRSLSQPGVGGGQGIRWGREVWGLQWRLALTCVSGYLAGAVFTPVAFRLHGPLIAGQVGMTMAVVNAISAMSWTWVSAKAATMGRLVASGRAAEARDLLRQGRAASFSTALAGSLAVFAAVVVVFRLNWPLAERLLSPMPTVLALAAAIAMVQVNAQFAWLRAHKKESLVWVAVGQGLLTAASAWWLGQRVGPVGMMAGQLVVVLMFVVPLAAMVTRRAAATPSSGASSEEG